MTESNVEIARRGFEAVLSRDVDAIREFLALSANLIPFRDGKAIEMAHYPNPEDALAAAGV
jgi:hypothetical protein